MRLQFLRLLPLVCLLSGCVGDQNTNSRQRTFIALGTLVTVEIREADDTQAKNAFARIEKLLQESERDWHSFGDGELGRVNQQLASGQSATTSVELAALISRSLHYSDLSDGLFNPVIGQLVELWGFDNDVQRTAPPNPDAIENFLDTQASLKIEGNKLRATAPLKVDLGGVAKGTVIALAIAELVNLGIEHGMVEAGGDVQVLGNQNGRPWRIGIRDPGADAILASVDLDSGEAIVTSGNYERYFEHAGRRYSHLLNPSTGLPVAETAAVTVIHDNPELADAAATALMVAGSPRFDEISARMGIATALLIDRNGKLHMTPAMRQRLNFGRQM